MRRYLIIAIAIMAAILVMSLVKMIKARRAKARGEIPHKTSGIDLAPGKADLPGMMRQMMGTLCHDHMPAIHTRHQPDKNRRRPAGVFPEPDRDRIKMIRHDRRLQTFRHHPSPSSGKKAPQLHTPRRPSGPVTLRSASS